MTLPFWCLLVVVLMPIALALAGGYFKTQQFGAIDNKNPRAQAAQLQGTGARVNAAQQNAWEALAMFAPAVLVAHVAGASATWSGVAAVVFVAARVAHAYFYIADIDKARSLAFGVALLCVLWLFGLAA
jgi:uncharacterized MAPEG superfamily protein